MIDSGMSTSTPLRLLLLAPRIEILRSEAGLRYSGTSIRFLPLKYCPVKDFYLSLPFEVSH